MVEAFDKKKKFGPKCNKIHILRITIPFPYSKIIQKITSYSIKFQENQNE